MNNQQPQKPQDSSIATVIIFFVLLFLFFKWGPNLPVSVLSQQKGEPLTVTGEGKVSVTPDIAKLTIGIQESGSSLKSLQESVNKKSKSLTDALKEIGIKENDIKTTNYSVYPQYDWASPGQRITGYQVSSNYQVTIRDFDKINEAITLGSAMGANMIDGVSFELNEDTEKNKLNEARKLAVEEAKSKASGLADAAGISLGKIINVSENQTTQRPPLYATDKVSLESSLPGLEKQATPPNVEPGQTEISVLVTLFYEIR